MQMQALRRSAQAFARPGLVLPLGSPRASAHITQSPLRFLGRTYHSGSVTRVDNSGPWPLLRAVEIFLIFPFDRILRLSSLGRSLPYEYSTSNIHLNTYFSTVLFVLMVGSSRRPLCDFNGYVEFGGGTLEHRRERARANW